MAYKQRLREEDSNINYLMTLYLHEKITPAVVKGAKAQGVVGIKSYPAGVTTNSSSGVLDYEVFYPVFRAMEQCGMVLNLHGECPSDHGNNITILNAESSFLPTLKSLHAQFPKVSHCCSRFCWAWMTDLHLLSSKSFWSIVQLVKLLKLSMSAVPMLLERSLHIICIS